MDDLMRDMFFDSYDDQYYEEADYILDVQLGPARLIQETKKAYRLWDQFGSFWIPKKLVRNLPIYDKWDNLTIAGCFEVKYEEER